MLPAEKNIKKGDIEATTEQPLWPGHAVERHVGTGGNRHELLLTVQNVFENGRRLQWSWAWEQFCSWTIRFSPGVNLTTKANI